jgi:hypothetical protein
MAKIGYLERKIFSIEGINVRFKQGGKDVRSDKSISGTYEYHNAAPDNFSASNLILGRLKDSFPGFEFDVLDAFGNIVPGNTKLKTIRKSYEKNS